MNLSMVLNTVGILLLCESAAMLPSLFIAVIYGENTIFAFIYAILITAIAGFSFFSVKPKENIIRYKEGFAIVSFSWLSASILGALPFLFTGVLPSFIDAFF